MADEVEDSEWGRAMAAALADNTARGTKPHTWWTLGTMLAKDERSTQNADSWRTEVKKIRKKQPSNEAKAQLIADTLGVDRQVLPPVTKAPTTAELNDLLEGLAAKVATLTEEQNALTDRVAQLEAAATPRKRRPDAAKGQ